jgi:hypothetical protein
MARRRNSIPPIQAPRRQSRGIAGAAWEKHVGSGPFGQPGSGRPIRQFPVETQREIVAREQSRAIQKERRRTERGIVEAIRGDDSILFTQDLRAQSSMTLKHPDRPEGPSNPRRPRAEAAGYDSRSQTVRVRFRVGADSRFPQGAVYEYYNVPRNVWRNLQRSASPGRFIDRVLDSYPYASVDEAFRPTRFFQADPE